MRPNMLGFPWRRTSFKILLPFILLALPSQKSAAEEVPEFEMEERPFAQPLPFRNDHPLYLTLFSTAFPDRARTLAPHRWAWEAGYLNSNSIVEQHNVLETDRIIVDGEMQRFEVSFRYGLIDSLELKVTFPYLLLGGGYMDDFIESFEDIFGFKTPGSRESRETGQFRYLFRVNRVDLIDKSGGSIDGLGDIPLQLKFKFRDSPEGILPRLAIRGLVKFPSATDPLLGNERVDGGIGLLAEQPIGKRMLLLANVDATTTHLPLSLKTIDLDPVMVSGSLAFEHFLTERVSWKWQWTAATNPYPKFHSDMTALNGTPMGIGLGWIYRFKPRAALQVGVAENISSAWSDFSWSASFQGEF